MVEDTVTKTDNRRLDGRMMHDIISYFEGVGAGGVGVVCVGGGGGGMDEMLMKQSRGWIS